MKARKAPTRRTWFFSCTSSPSPPPSPVIGTVTHDRITGLTLSELVYFTCCHHVYGKKHNGLVRLFPVIACFSRAQNRTRVFFTSMLLNRFHDGHVRVSLLPPASKMATGGSCTLQEWSCETCVDFERWSCETHVLFRGGH